MDRLTSCKAPIDTFSNCCYKYMVQSLFINFIGLLILSAIFRHGQPAMSIKPLPGDVVAQIKSSVVITSLNNVICGLIKNSLDAAATKINVSIDYSRGNCSVEDDGDGIQPTEFEPQGGLGQLHCMGVPVPTMLPHIPLLTLLL